MATKRKGRSYITASGAISANPGLLLVSTSVIANFSGIQSASINTAYLESDSLVLAGDTFVLAPPIPFSKVIQTEGVLNIGATASIRFYTYEEGGSLAFPTGSSYYALVKFDGESAPKRHLVMNFQSEVNAKGYVLAHVYVHGRSVGRDPKVLPDPIDGSLFNKGKTFSILQGDKIIGAGQMIGPPPPRPVPPYLQNTLGLPFN